VSPTNADTLTNNDTNPDPLADTTARDRRLL
jgi:hypothetical protein